MAKSILDRFQVALITGGSGGLGKKMASNLISHGKKIVIAGRRMDKLDAAAKELGPNVIGRYAVDVGNTATLAPFVEKVVQEHPEVDCVINNAGIQNLMNYAEKIDVSAVEQEISINVTSVAILCALFAPHLQSKQSAVLMNIASGLAYVPRAASPVYSATKAFVLSFTQSLRVQFDKTSVTGWWKSHLPWWRQISRATSPTPVSIKWPTTKWPFPRTSS